MNDVLLGFVKFRGDCLSCSIMCHGLRGYNMIYCYTQPTGHVSNNQRGNLVFILHIDINVQYFHVDFRLFNLRPVGTHCK